MPFSRDNISTVADAGAVATFEATVNLACRSICAADHSATIQVIQRSSTGVDKDLARYLRAWL